MRTSILLLAAMLVAAQTPSRPKRFVFDGHVHAVDRILFHGGGIGERKTDGQWDLSRAREGGVGAVFFSVYVPDEYYPARLETRHALRGMDLALREIRKNEATLELALNGGDVERIRKAGKMAAVLDLEGSADLDGDLGILRNLHRLGLRSAQLSAHNTTSGMADSCCAAAKWSGLNDKGRAWVREMNRLGMVINVSHASDAALSQTIDLSTAPVVATHHGLRHFNDIPRNMPDDLLKKLAAKGGVVGFQLGSEFHSRRLFDYRTSHQNKPFWDTGEIQRRGASMTPVEVDAIAAPQFPMPGFVFPIEMRITVDDWVNVVDYAIQLVGEDHVALGSDFDGGLALPTPMRDVRDIGMIAEAMDRRGYSEKRIQKFLGGNLLRVFGEITGGQR